MKRTYKFVCLIAVLLVGAFAMTACGNKEEAKKVEIELSNAAGMQIEYVKAIRAEDADTVIDLTSDIKDGESIVFEFDGEKENYLIQIKFADSEFVYTSKEVLFDGLTKIELTSKDGTVILDVFHSDEKENIFLEQPAPSTASDEEVQEEPVAETQQAPVEQAPAANPQPSAPANPPAETKPQQDGCLNDALFN